MATTVTCPACQTPVSFPEGGPQELRCPRCGNRVRAPGVTAEEGIMEVQPVVRPASEGIREVQPAGRRSYPADEGEDLSSPYKPCPKCGARGAERVTWTPWGSFYGPYFFNHVRCPQCGYKYNGKTGRSNLVPAILFVLVPLIGILVVLGGLFVWILHVTGRLR
jgi:DNA-directed RNA polymerase subunit RPC12/RpoP